MNTIKVNDVIVFQNGEESMSGVVAMQEWVFGSLASYLVSRCGELFVVDAKTKQVK